ncbi:hypothetical protein CVT26_013181 [Gymnopilus dilepis]|uniref:GST N-terminal domain-containing protein n=1 Tax=Gymnopilus dilepis TaxID=231916 RepID=A0A409YFH0_9AGAR|nr:hypothetical protein CVT26_013181 [Gymnopilus dilepis]
MTIILYDIPSPLPEKAWSPNVWKIRYCLNYRKIPYHTEWVEYPDIMPLSERLGVKPTRKNRDGSDCYTLPAIHDTSTGTSLSESLLIAEYLDKAYPDTPRILPYDTIALQAAFAETWNNERRKFAGFSIPPTLEMLNSASKAFYRRAREMDFGMTMEELVPQDEDIVRRWVETKEVFGKFDEWYAKMDGPDGKARFLMGDVLSFGDLVVAASLKWLKTIWGEESEKWQELLTWHGGRWKALLKELKGYETVI